jgi:hypothetical protein
VKLLQTSRKYNYLHNKKADVIIFIDIYPLLSRFSDSNAPVKVNPPPPHPGIYVGISLNRALKLTNAPLYGEEFCGK